MLGVPVDSVKVDAIGTGQTGATYRITPTYSRQSGGPQTLVAKLPSQDAEVRQRVALGYRAEHAFYTRVAATVSIPLVRLYYGEISNDGSEFVLLLSDSAPAVQGDQIRGCSADEALLAVEALTGLHGPRWCDPAWLSFDSVTMPRADADFARGMGQLAQMATATTLSSLGTQVGPQDRKTLIESAELIEPWLGINPDRFSLLHGDFRLDNILFDPKGTVTVVDWQTITVGLPARDLAYFLGTSMIPDERTAHEAELVTAYHQRLTGYGVTDYVAEQCWADYRLGMLHTSIFHG